MKKLLFFLFACSVTNLVVVAFFFYNGLSQLFSVLVEIRRANSYAAAQIRDNSILKAMTISESKFVRELDFLSDGMVYSAVSSLLTVVFVVIIMINLLHKIHRQRLGGK